jgi:uncharacterized protein (DUF1800 family)
MTRRQFGAITGATALASVAPAGFDAAIAGPSTRHAPVSDVEHVLRRTTYGATPSLVHEVERRGIGHWLDAQLHPHQVHDGAMDHLLKRWPALRWNPWQVRRHYKNHFGTWDVMFDLVDAHIARSVWSKRQLLEVMVDFWSNHLNVTCPSSDVWDNRHVYDRDVIRKHALGSFSDMLVSCGRSPAMLHYLGNAFSTGDAPNENWARELLELHTVGIDAGYSQNDVRNSALILSGLSVEPDGGGFEYKPWMHYTGHVKVMGFAAGNHSAAKGEALAKDYLRWLAHHPSTAKHLAYKLSVRFVSDKPSASLVNHLAGVYRRNHTQIVPVLRALFASEEFKHSKGAKVRTPYEDFIATLRVLRVGPPHKGTEGIRSLQWMSSSVGQPPLAWHAPNGYADTAAAWSSTSATLGRWNVHMNLAGQWWPKELHYTKVAALVPKPTPKTYGHLVDALVRALNVPAFNPVQRAAVAEFLGHKPGDALASTDPALNWRLPYIVALILDSSNQAER